MALTKTLTREGDLPVADAYLKIVQLDIQAYGDKDQARIHVATYLDKATADANGARIGSVVESFMPSIDKSKNVMEQAYVFLKTTPDLSDAADALEAAPVDAPVMDVTP